MKKVVILSFIVLLCSFNNGTTTKKDVYKAYYACTCGEECAMDDSVFVSLLNQPLCVRDTANNLFKVQHFEITYAERGLYQDSTGLPIITTDYSFTECTGDTIPVLWQKIFTDRAYKGDTVFFDHVIIQDANKRSMACKGIKVILK